jgi:hypothetical protein
MEATPENGRARKGDFGKGNEAMEKGNLGSFSYLRTEQVLEGTWGGRTTVRTAGVAQL